MKKVKYMGQVFEVPDWARYIAKSFGTYVFAYECHPTSFKEGRSEYIGAVPEWYIKKC